MTPELQRALERLRTKGLRLTPQTGAALERSVGRYSQFLGEHAIEAALAEIKSGIETILNPRQVERADRITPENPRGLVTEGATQSSVRGDLLQLLDRFSGNELAASLNLDFKIETAVNVAQGAGRFVEGQTDVEEYPAWELYRAYDRDKPRLWKGDEGTDDAITAGFASRWYRAAQIANDPDAARVLEETGRMIALKSSGIWQALGDFEDGLGNPFPPFAFNSGMEVDGVPHVECVELGLIAEGEPVAGTDFDFNTLFHTEVAA